MYLAKELNRKKLFRRTSNFAKNDKCRDILPLILYRASACLLSFEKIAQFQYKCAEEFALFDDQVIIKDNRVLFVSPTSILILNEITPLLINLRILQNLFILFIGKYYKKSLPSSISDFINKKDKFNIPDEVKNIIINYWVKSGEYLRDLRDIDQHFYYLIENSFMTIEPKCKINILFPDDPKNKSSDSFTFKNNIDGLEFLSKSFYDINSIFEEFSKYIGFEEKNILFVIALKHLMKNKTDDKRTIFMFYEESLKMIGNNHANLAIQALRFNQLPDGKGEVHEIGPSKQKLEKRNNL